MPDCVVYRLELKINVKGRHDDNILYTLGLQLYNISWLLNALELTKSTLGAAHDLKKLNHIDLIIRF